MLMWRLAASTRTIVRGTISSRNGLRSIATAASTAKAPPSPLLSAQRHVVDATPMPTSYRTFSSQNTNPAINYLCVHVFVSVKPGTENDFLAASLANARASSLEPGIARFDVIQQEDDATKFVLVEVYKNADAPAAHKGTDHYLTWRESVEHMMAEPRRAINYKNIFPATAGGWDYGDGISLE
mmetsp:Transcript_13083/g.21369  ORF Transcript_13083/g.21369 Transcript_13083/m.21369 type:complete len:183 (-) Transcript_13083:418-966(-)